METKLSNEDKARISVKIGRKQYEVKESDYFMDNGACIQFCAGDGRCLNFERWTEYTSLVISKSEWKRLCRNYPMTEKKVEKHFTITIYRINQTKTQ